MSKWQKFNPIENEKLPVGPGCYVIYADGVVVYVGQATNVRKRLRAYNFRWSYSNNCLCSFDSEPVFFAHRISVKVRGSDRYGDWAMRELRLIRKLKPRFNCAGGGRLVRKNGSKKSRMVEV